MSVLMQFVDTAQYLAVDLPENCTLVDPIAEPVLNIAGAIVSLIKWLAVVVFVLLVFALLIPIEIVRKVSIIGIIVIVVVGLLSAGIVQVGSGAVGATC